MPTFKRLKFHATVETEAMLLSEDQVRSAIADLRDKLEHLDLEVVTMETTEPAAAKPQQSSSDDPWSLHGNPVD